MFAIHTTLRFACLVLLSAAVFFTSPAYSVDPDISTVAADLVIPPVNSGKPVPGKRVFYRLPSTPVATPDIVLYLPTDWMPQRRYPVLVEYAGNANFKNAYGDTSTGRPEGSQLGYGLSAGKGYIWVCLPFLNDSSNALATTWWGDRPRYLPGSTVAFAKRAVPEICRLFSGDEEHVILCGFSRGALACNAIGLHDDEVAKLWRGFFCYSHYEGVHAKWPYADSDPESAKARLLRLGNRPQFICHENSVDVTRNYLVAAKISGNFTYAVTGFRNHNDAWLLRQSPARETARTWLSQLLAK